MASPFVEIVGYVASIAVAASLMMTRVVRLRWWNFAGALTFAAYGALLGAWPVFAVNLLIAGINVWFLWKLSHRRESFEILEVEVRDGASPGSRYLRRFLSFHCEDIRRFFPHFDLDRHVAEATDELHVAFTLRDLVPVALIVYELGPGRRALVHLDYATPDYRDLRNARYLYREMTAALGARRVRELVAASWHPQHDDYLRRLGFSLQKDEGGHRLYVRAAASDDAGPSYLRPDGATDGARS